MAWEVKRLRIERAGAAGALLTARRCRLKAEECRAVADELRDNDARRTILAVAVYYERLADRHERSMPTRVDTPSRRARSPTPELLEKYAQASHRGQVRSG